MDLSVLRNVYKGFFSDFERGMVLRIIMDISRKDSNGNHIKKQCLANIGNILWENYVEPTNDFTIGYNMKNEVICKEIKSWEDNKKKLISNLIIILLIYPTGKATFIEEINEAKAFYDKTNIIEPKFDSVAQSFYS